MSIILADFSKHFALSSMVNTSEFLDAISQSGAFFLNSEFAKVFSVNQQLRVLLSNFCMCMCHWIEIYYCNKHLWKIHNWKIQLSFPFLHNVLTKNRKISIPKFHWATQFFDPIKWINDQLSNFASHFCLCA